MIDGRLCGGIYLSSLSPFSISAVSDSTSVTAEEGVKILQMISEQYL